MVETTKEHPTQTLTQSEYWQQHLLRCAQSTLSKVQYCREHQLVYHQMMYWQKRLQPVLPKSSEHSATGFVPVIVNNSADVGNGLSLTLPNGLQIHGITDNTLSLVKPLLSQL